jgi:hypothetical protein
MRGMRNGKTIEGSISIAALFDPLTGHIAHLHRVINFASNKNITSDYVQQRAKDLYALTGKDASKLKAISIHPEKLNKGSRYRVDVTTFELVEIDRSEGRGRLI